MSEEQTASSVGAGTRMVMHRLRRGSMIRLADSQQRIILQMAAYSSIMRRNECCASLDNFSASSSKITIMVEKFKAGKYHHYSNLYMVFGCHDSIGVFEPFV
jgi:hypothetical protein